MKYNCDIVRDLMPLCIDGTASDKTRQMVDEHVEECPPCHEIYQEMKQEVSAEPPVQKEKEPFNGTVKKLRKKRKLRTVLGVVLGVMIGLMLVLYGGGLVSHLQTDYARTADDDDYRVTMARRTNGQIVFTKKNLSGTPQQLVWQFDEHTGILTLYAMTPTLPSHCSTTENRYIFNEIYWKNDEQKLIFLGTAYYGDTVEYHVKEVQRGKFDSNYGLVKEILYVDGNEIPLVDTAIDAAYEPGNQTIMAVITPMPMPTPMPTATVNPTLVPDGWTENQPAAMVTPMPAN